MKIRTLIFIWIIIVGGSMGAETSNSTCNFNEGLCTWTQAQSGKYDDFDWTRMSEKRIFTNTCQVSDHTSRGKYEAGGYLYINSKNAMANTKATLFYLWKDSGNYCLSFWYFVCGHNVTELRIIYKKVEERGQKETLFNTSGVTGQMWILKQLDISTTNRFKILIEGWIKDDDFGVLALDDIELSNNKCPKNCGDPTPEFGFVRNKDFKIGSTVQVSCNAGYRIEGKVSIDCLTNGSWSRILKCIRVESDSGAALITTAVTVPLCLISFLSLTIYTLYRKRKLRCVNGGKSRTEPKTNVQSQYPYDTFTNSEMLTVASTTATSQEKDANTEYAVVSKKRLFVSTSSVKHGADVRNNADYDHIKTSFIPVLDNTYSHLQDKCDSSIHKQSKNSADTNASFQRSDDDYNHINLDRPMESIKRNFAESNEEQESEYDHAKAGRCDPVTLDLDEYSHLNTVVKYQGDLKAGVNVGTLSNSEQTYQKLKDEYKEPSDDKVRYFTTKQEENTMEDTV